MLLEDIDLISVIALLYLLSFTFFSIL